MKQQLLDVANRQQTKKTRDLAYHGACLGRCCHRTSDWVYLHLTTCRTYPISRLIGFRRTSLTQPAKRGLGLYEKPRRTIGKRVVILQDFWLLISVNHSAFQIVLVDFQTHGEYPTRMTVKQSHDAHLLRPCCVLRYVSLRKTRCGFAFPEIDKGFRDSDLSSWHKVLSLEVNNSLFVTGKVDRSSLLDPE